MAKKAAAAAAAPTTTTTPLEMGELVVLSKQITETISRTIGENTAVFSYAYQLNHAPLLVGFSLVRGVAGSDNYTGNAVITGSLQASRLQENPADGNNIEQNKTWDIKNVDYQPLDSAICDCIYNTCLDIITPAVEVETDDENQEAEQEG